MNLKPIKELEKYMNQTTTAPDTAPQIELSLVDLKVWQEELGAVINQIEKRLNNVLRPMPIQNATEIKSGTVSPARCVYVEAIDGIRDRLKSQKDQLVELLNRLEC